MLFRLVSPPTTEPISLDEAKKQLRLESALDDAFVQTLLIPAARQWVEEHCRRALVTQTWEALLTGFPSSGIIELGKGTLSSVASVKYLDANGVEQTLALGEYEVDTTSVPGRVLLAYGKSWPTTRAAWNAVRIRFDAGWAAASIPVPIKQATLLLVSHMYEHRTPEVSEIDFAAEALLNPYRVMVF